MEYFYWINTQITQSSHSDFYISFLPVFLFFCILLCGKLLWITLSTILFMQRWVILCIFLDLQKAQGEKSALDVYSIINTLKCQNYRTKMSKNKSRWTWNIILGYLIRHKSLQNRKSCWRKFDYAVILFFHNEFPTLIKFDFTVSFNLEHFILNDCQIWLILL